MFNQAASPVAPPVRYSAIAIGLHWVLAAAIAGNFALGVYMHELAFSMTRLKLYNWHKWAGVTILALSALRLIWRMTHRPPADVAMAAWQARASHAVHGLLYALFFAVPLTGWAYSSAAGFPITLFGVLPLPDFIGVDKPLADAVLKPLHEAAALSLAGLVLLHVGAALKHHFVDRDGLLKRMRLGRG